MSKHKETQYKLAHEAVTNGVMPIRTACQKFGIGYRTYFAHQRKERAIAQPRQNSFISKESQKNRDGLWTVLVLITFILLILLAVKPWMQ